MAMILAEISGNHDGQLDKAQELIAAAASAGCDAVKFQLYKPDDMPKDGGDYERYQVPVDWLSTLFATADQCRIKLFASVFAPWAIEALEQFEPFAYKLASPESTRLPVKTYRELERVIKDTGKLFIASTGRADCEFVKSLYPDEILYCVAGYPATIDDSDIEYASTYTTGFSDHTDGIIAPLAMIGAGAGIIEKHFKIDENCIDAAFSLNPQQMKLLCDLAHR